MVTRKKVAPAGVEVPIVLMGEGDEEGKIPTRAYKGDSGVDLYNIDDSIIAPLTRAQLRTNICIAIPANMFGLLLARSSAFHKKGLVAHTSIIDPGFMGEVKILVHNQTRSGIHIMAGERIAQLVVVPFVPVTFKPVKALPRSERGTRGFGSSEGYEGPRARKG